MPRTESYNESTLPPGIRRQFLQVVPFNVAVIDRDYNIVEANDDFKEYFGNWQGKKCYQVYKKLNRPCEHCQSFQTFSDGKTRVVDETGIDQRGKRAHYVVHIAPLRSNPSGPVKYVIEMSSDVTETKRWQREYHILFDRVPCYITVIDQEFRIVRANEAFREQFGDVRGERCYEIYKRRRSKCPRCPAAKTFKDGQVHKSEQIGVSKAGERTDYVVATSPLTRGEDKVAHVIEICNDVTEIKKLEEDMLDAERLAAVGQTVAGLAHSVKNILMGLEGGKYIVSLGLERDDKEVIAQGWEILERNFDKTTALVKDFLSFAKGRLPTLQMVHPNSLVQEIVDLYREVAKKSNIDLRTDLSEAVRTAPLDPDGIHTCLTNLVSNALDACQMSERKDCTVTICTREAGSVLTFEVTDTGGGMDYEIKKKVFTTFFTTKGGQGTGLGLLTTRKIVQEHGGRIQVRSRPGEGARFRMTFPRNRLLALYRKQEHNEEQ